MKKKGSEPPSLFDNFDLFAQSSDTPAEQSDEPVSEDNVIPSDEAAGDSQT